MKTTLITILIIIGIAFASEREVLSSIKTAYEQKLEEINEQLDFSNEDAQTMGRRIRGDENRYACHPVYPYKDLYAITKKGYDHLTSWYKDSRCRKSCSKLFCLPYKKAKFTCLKDNRYKPARHYIVNRGKKIYFYDAGCEFYNKKYTDNPDPKCIGGQTYNLKKFKCECPKGTKWVRYQRKCVKTKACKADQFYSTSQKKCINKKRDCPKDQYWSTFGGACLCRADNMTVKRGKCVKGCPSDKKYYKKDDKCYYISTYYEKVGRDLTRGKRCYIVNYPFVRGLYKYKRKFYSDPSCKKKCNTACQDRIKKESAKFLNSKGDRAEEDYDEEIVGGYDESI